MIELIAWHFAFPCLAAFLVTFLATPLVIRLANAIGMVDRPDARRIHKMPTARGGGIAVIAGFHMAGLALFLASRHLPHLQAAAEAWLRILPATLVLAVVGVVDDRFGMPPVRKLLGQVLAAVLAFAMGTRFAHVLGIELPPLLDAALTIVWFIGFVNAFNLIDGLDGLASGLAVIGSIGLAGAMWLRGAGGELPLALALLGAALAFLRYNFYPARVFLGDTGSMFIGFTLAGLAMTGQAKGTFLVSVVVPVLAIGVPVFDTALAVWRRMVRRVLQAHLEPGSAAHARVFAPDAEHLHHRLLRAWKSQRTVASYLYLLNAMIAAAGLCAAALNSYTTAIFISALVTAGFILFRHTACIEMWDSGMAIVLGLARPPRNRMAVVFYPFADFALLLLAWAIAEILGRGGPMEAWHHASAVACVIWVGIPFLSLALAGAYKRVWSMARLSDLALLFLALAAGVLLAAALASLRYQIAWRETMIAMMAVWSVAYTGIVGVRLLPRTVEDVLPRLWYRRAADGIHAPLRTLILSAGSGCTMFLRAQMHGGVHALRTRHIVGVLDDDPHLRNRHVYGLPVLGNIAMLEDVARRYDINEIIVARPPGPQIAAQLEELSARLGIRLLYWRAGLTSETTVADETLAVVA